MGYEQKMVLINPYMNKLEKVIHLNNVQLTKTRFVTGGFSVISHKYLDNKDRTRVEVPPYFYLADGSSKVLVSKVINQIDPKNYFDAIVCGVIGMVDLCKTGGLQLPKSEIKVAHYTEDGNTLICKDCYGEYLYMYDPKDVLEALKEANKQLITDTNPRGYRRFAMAIDLLEGAISDFDDELKITFFGY